ncbi:MULTISPECIES: hypothetical protein [unclassified Arsenophonus]|uniref:hypothetical protein n=1 Tax=unclassified Arsenophonus TaxID=2627083 RepID=UPI00286573F0|nr:hypothetical protein [Arsenophonus sp.]MDR5610417.1 hypothetical protein [Arsenophonus sp.]
MKKSQLDIVKEALTELGRMSDDEFITILTEVGLLDNENKKNQMNRFVFSLSKPNRKQVNGKPIWIECQSVTHNTMRMSL